MHQVELRLQAQVTADRAGTGLLHRIRPAGNLAERGHRAGPLQDRGKHRTRGDELQQRGKEWLVGVLRVVCAGQRVVDVL